MGWGGSIVPGAGGEGEGDMIEVGSVRVGWLKGRGVGLIVGEKVRD